MNRKNVIRTLTVIAVVLLLGWSFFYFSDNTRGYKPVDTSVAMAQINSDNVKSAQIDDREQQLRLDLKNGNGDTSDSDKIITKYPTGYGVTLFDALSAKNAKVNTVVNQGSVLGSLLIYMLPLLLLVGLFVMFSRMQTGGRMGFGFGKSRAKQLSKDMPKTTFADVAGRRRGGRGALRDQGLPAEPVAVPGARRQDPQGRAAVRPARHRQDAPGPRRRG